MKRLFGTDGIRGAFGEPPLDRSTVVAVGSALAEQLSTGGRKPRILLGGDTRDSTPELSAWIAAGAAVEGATVEFAGTVPTPAVAHLVVGRGADAGVAISASHNPHPDNGIKLIGADGFKWDEGAEGELERRILERLDHPTTLPPIEPPPVDPALAEAYRDHLVEKIGPGSLRGLSIVLDCAHGAASGLATDVFTRTGALVVTLGDSPDGRNINRERGSTAPAAAAARVAAVGADLGFAFDGDADRAIAIDEKGEIRDGDAMLYLWAGHLADRDRLPQRRIVATSMSNLGLEVALAKRDISLVRCDVGDRVVVETLRREGLRLGGEQSGHLIDLEMGTTGDGLLSAGCLARIVAAAATPFSELLRDFVRFPQTLRGVRVREKPPFDELPGVLEIARAIEKELGDRGRLVLRYSGTEPLARVMIEGPDREQIEALATRLLEAIDDTIGVDLATSDAP